MSTKKVKIRGVVREFVKDPPPISDVKIKVYDYFLEDWLLDTVTTNDNGRYKLVVDLKIDPDDDDKNQVRFYIKATKSGYDSAGRDKRTAGSSTRINLYMIC